MKNVSFRPHSLVDITETASYLAIQSTLEVADRFQDAVQSTTDNLVLLPGMGAPCSFNDPRLKGTRRVPVNGFKNWLVFYQVTEECIDVLGILHGARDIEAIFEDEPGRL